MENAILEHAAALRELAGAVRDLTRQTDGAVIAGTRVTGFRDEFAAPYTGDLVVNGNIKATGDVYARVAAKADGVQEKVERAVQKVGDTVQKMEQAAKDAEIEQAVQKVEQAAKEEKAPPAAEPAAEHPDFAKDVRPVLLTAVKTAHVGKAGVAALLAKYDATHADKLDPKHYTAVIAEANALIAG